MIETKRKVDLEEFERVSYQIDYSLDMATQYPNKEILDTLRHLRHLGKKIYLVTDYYLPGKCYTSYLRPLMVSFVHLITKRQNAMEIYTMK